MLRLAGVLLLWAAAFWFSVWAGVAVVGWAYPTYPGNCGSPLVRADLEECP